MSPRNIIAVIAAVCALAGPAIALADEQADFSPDAIPTAQTIPDDPGFSSALPQTERFIAIYGGSTKGTYYQVASAICAAVEASFSKHHIRCVSLRSQGDLSNVSLMAEGRAQFIIVQSNTSNDIAEKRLDLPTARSVMSLHDELGLMVTAAGQQIDGVGDLRGKRVNLGPEGSSSRRLWKQLLSAEGVELSDLATVYDAAQDLNQRGLCDGDIDAFGLWIGHPASAIATSISICNARIVGMRSPATDRLVAEHPDFFNGEIPAGTYPNQDKPIPSYGFKATLVADSRVDPDLVYWLTRSVVENIGLFRQRHPALASVAPRAMFEKGNFLPFHEGAARYWREVGWLAK